VFVFIIITVVVVVFFLFSFLQEIMKVLIDVMTILEQMHLLGFIHRDIKSSNILIGCDGKFKLSLLFIVVLTFLFASFKLISTPQRSWKGKLEQQQWLEHCVTLFYFFYYPFVDS
jgi:serine/threonine protein kinase